MSAVEHGWEIPTDVRRVMVWPTELDAALATFAAERGESATRVVWESVVEHLEANGADLNGARDAIDRVSIPDA